MIGLAGMMLSLSIKGTLAALLVAVVVKGLGSRLAPSLRHALWLLVVLRLLLPVSPAASWSLFRLAAEGPVAELLPWPGTGAGSSAEVRVGADTTTTSSWPPDLEGSLVALWLLGAGAYLGRLLLRHQRQRACFSQATEVTDPRARRALTRNRASLGVGRAVRWVESGAVAAPAVFGSRRPTIVTPPGWTQLAHDDELDHVLLHELAHLKRRDLLWDGLCQLAVAIHWFNPLAHHVARRVREERELACDAMALSRISRVSRADYAATLLRICRTSLSTSLGAAFASPSMSKKLLERRILLISGYRPTSRPHFVAMTGLVLLTALVVLSDPPRVWSQPATTDAEESELADNPEAATRETVLRVRNLGAAMFAWYESQHGEYPQVGEEAKSASWPECPQITAEQLAGYLVPDYLPEIPATDGWGNPLEFCFAPEPRGLNKDRWPANAGVRSAGHDGRFDGPNYSSGAFPLVEVGHDIVWMDGYFVNWPQREPER